MSGPLVPFRQVVLKVHSRCDLACRHCYVYEHADQSWSARPKVVSEEAVSWTAHRLAEHAKTHALPSVHVILHGGEPLLAGPARLRRVCEELRGRLDGITELDLRIHTNGVQLSERYLDLFAEFDVKVGVSLDGDKAANDRHRVYANGRSSHQRVLDAVALLRQERYRHLYAGLLCTVDVANDPVAVYDALAELAPPRIDFLLPHATWDEPPVRPDGASTPYADWLMRIFDRWDAAGRPMPVRLFDSVISTLDGGPSLTESLGLGPADLVVIETDGTLEQADSLKTAYDGAPATGFDVFADSLDSAARHPGVLARQRGLAGLSRQCVNCPVVRSCGGGLYAHRFRTGSGFDNPSVYCADLKSLVERIGSRTGRPAPGPVAAAAARAEREAAPLVAAVADVADEAVLAELAAAQRLVTHDWLRLIDARLAGSDPRWDAAWQWLTAPGARTDVLDAVLAHPYTRSWAAACLDALDVRDAQDVGGTGHEAADLSDPTGRAHPDRPDRSDRPVHRADPAHPGAGPSAGHVAEPFPVRLPEFAVAEDVFGALDEELFGPDTHRAAGVGSGLAAPAHLASLAAAAALRTAGTRHPLPVPVAADGTVSLPGLGRAVLARSGPATADVQGTSAAFVIRRGEEEVRVLAGTPHDRRWQPVRALAATDPVTPAVPATPAAPVTPAVPATAAETAALAEPAAPTGSAAPTGPAVSAAADLPAGGPVLAPLLDDVDPYRDSHHRAAAPRLSAGEAEAWGRGLTGAWRVLRAAVPARAAELAAGLVGVTPVVPGAAARRASVLAGGRRGLGAVGVVFSSDPAVLAGRLLAAWQHAKLDALLERVELYDETAPHSFPPPWGGAPLPAGELLAHAYARTATAALAADPAAHAAATVRALDDLRDTGVLTAPGALFAARLRSALTGSTGVRRSGTAAGARDADTAAGGRADAAGR
jgi:radical SAM/SPASM domain FxsB family protein